MENDAINKTDKHLTNTLSFSYVNDFNGSHTKLFGLEKDSYAITIVQDTYTPKNTQTTDKSKFDMPYAGHLYGTYNYINWNRKKYHSLALSLGYIGDETECDEMQKRLHIAIGNDVPKGWHHQIDNKYTYQFTYNYGTMLYENTILKRDIKLSKNYRIDYGNFLKLVSANYQLKSGKNYPTNFSSIENLEIESLSLAPKSFGFSYGYGLSLIYIDDAFIAERSREFKRSEKRLALEDELSYSIYSKDLKIKFYMRFLQLASESRDREILGGFRVTMYNF